MKKKLVTLLTALALAGSLISAPAVLAADKQQVRQQDQTCATFVDKDNDGVCDNAKDRTPQLKKDGSGKQAGTKAGKSAKSGTRKNFQDKNKDGVCDNAKDGAPQLKKDGSGKQAGTKAGKSAKSGTKKNYQDKNKDGVCDNAKDGAPLLKKDGSGGKRNGR